LATDQIVNVISVVIPTYNRARPLVTAIKSVLAQTYVPLEILVVDDGSTDGTADAVQGMIENTTAGTNPRPHIRYFYQSNQGPSAARNRGIAEAAGNWIAFLDSDDTWLPEKLESQVRAIEGFAGECGACFTDARLVDSRGLDISAFQQVGWRFEESIGRIADLVSRLSKGFGGYWIQTLLARSDLARKVNGFDSDLRFGEDYDFAFRLSLITPHCYVNKPLVIIDRTTTIIDPGVAPRSWDRVDFRLRGRQYMYEKWLNLNVKSPTDLRRTIIQNLRSVHSSWTNWHLENKEFDKARRSVSAAMKYQITPQLVLKWMLTRIAPHVARRIVPKTAAML